MEVPDLSQIDDEEVLTLVLLDSTHPRIVATATEIKNSLLVSANQILKTLEGKKDSFARFASAVKPPGNEGEEGKVDISRETVESLLKKTKNVVDVSLQFTFELLFCLQDGLSFHAMNPIWGTEKSVRQSRKFLVQLLEKITSRGEAVILFLSSVLAKLPPPPSPPASPEPVNNTSKDGSANSNEGKTPEGGRGRGRGLHPPGAGRGRGVPLARGSGIGISPLFSSPEADSGLSPPGKDGGGDEGSRMQRKHERDESPDEGTQRRWKKKQPSNVDWMLKCKTKLFELKERTAKKAVSDVFLTERLAFAIRCAAVAFSCRASNRISRDWRGVPSSVPHCSSYRLSAVWTQALMLLAKETLNKRQLMGLFDSAVKVERLTTPSELLTEM
ncbi:hypothetical protein, conserved [Eimeria acervulina]|uniref:Uncharacterized protein n=1 Tax=Eimeria acervulina TaxID=5801 RepID=U6GB02_EIMAC|nr:hypothetical protein, conserved [Eimeria acervulina]CDI76697.1 hypothetical protein, conserved [Eimeria acervulina]